MRFCTVLAVVRFIQISKIREKRLISCIDELCTLLFPDNLAFRRIFVISMKSAFCKNIIFIAVMNFYIVNIRSHRQAEV